LSSDRLTRQELTWLLTQQARETADKLRKGVAIVSPSPGETASARIGSSFAPALDALDDAMTMLSSLHAGSPPRVRKGRIDLASLLWEVAPNARVAVEPGSGTEVHGDETELRRILQVLLASSSPAATGALGAAPEIVVRGEGSFVRVIVPLGPDASPNAETERAWLHRMAVRHGGRLELEGGTQSLILPADNPEDQREIQELRRELEAAQRQGEAYARELAVAFSQIEPVRILALAVAPLAIRLRGLFASIARDVNLVPRSGAEPQADAVTQRLTLTLGAGSELISDLARLGAADPGAPQRQTDLVEVVRDELAQLAARAGRHHVTVRSVLPDHAVEIATCPMVLALLVRSIVDDAVAATGNGGEVVVTVGTPPAAERRVELVVDDAGGEVSSLDRARRARLDAAPSARQRSDGMHAPWIWALAHALRAELAFEQAPRGLRTRLVFP
jgi:two-component system OmpR family sensor kinase